MVGGAWDALLSGIPTVRIGNIHGDKIPRQRILKNLLYDVHAPAVGVPHLPEVDSAVHGPAHKQV